MCRNAAQSQKVLWFIWQLQDNIVSIEITERGCTSSNTMEENLINVSLPVRTTTKGGQCVQIVRFQREII